MSVSSSASFILVINFPCLTGKLMRHFVVLPHLRLAVLQTLIMHLVELVEFLNMEVISGKVTNLA